MFEESLIFLFLSLSLSFSLFLSLSLSFSLSLSLSSLSFSLTFSFISSLTFFSCSFPSLTLTVSLSQRFVLPHIELPISPAVDGRLSTLAQSVEELRAAIAEQSNTVQVLSSGLQQRVARLESDGPADIRTELATLRTLALGRSQFPAAPPTPAIPAWQRARPDDHKDVAASGALATAVAAASSSPGLPPAILRSALDAEFAAAETPVVPLFPTTPEPVPAVAGLSAVSAANPATAMLPSGESAEAL